MAEEEAHGKHGPTVSSEAVGTLRKLKETETLWQKRLDEARSRGETKIKYAQAARERTLAEARREADTAHAQRLREAQAQATAESRQVLEEARAEAARLGNLSSAELDARLGEIMDALFGELRPTGGKGSASASSPKAVAVAAR